MNSRNQRRQSLPNFYAERNALSSQSGSNSENRRITLKHKQVEAAALLKLSMERGEMIKICAKRVAEVKNLLNEVLVTKNEIAKKYNSLLESHERMKELQTDFESKLTKSDQQMGVGNVIDEIQKLEAKLAQLPTEDELKRYANERIAIQNQIDDVQANIEATKKWMDERDFEMLQQQIHEKHKEMMQIDAATKTTCNFKAFLEEDSNSSDSGNEKVPPNQENQHEGAYKMEQNDEESDHSTIGRDV